MKTILKYIAIFFLSIWVGTAQNQPKITIEADTKTIKIGEQIKYQISVEMPKDQSVTFPEGQTFSPLEMVFSEPIDTFRQEEKLRLIKNYFLTQFDSGTYVIPSQRISVGNQFFATDSLLIEVKNVAVDTLQQPLFGIKPIISVEKPKTDWFWWWILGGVLVALLGIGVYFLFFRKKKLSEEQKIALLPAFDRAILGLQNLQNSKYLLEAKHKEYYSELTDIVRRYLEEEVHISATESTTDELVAKMELLLDSEKLNLSKETIWDFKHVLQKADLVKFAKSQPQDFEAQTDLQTIQNVVIKTKKALPQPSEEEKLQNEDYRNSVIKLKQRRRKIAAILTCVYVLFYGTLGVGGWFWYKKNFASETAQAYLDKKNWITSVYGSPPIKISTPEVLERKQSNLFPSGTGFVLGNALQDDFTMGLVTQASSLTKQNLTPETIDTLIKTIEENTQNQFKAQNILTKHDTYTTPQGVEGLKIFGSFDREVSVGNFTKMSYQNYIFFDGKSLCFMVFFYPKSEQESSEKLVEKVMNSVEFVQ